MKNNRKVIRELKNGNQSYFKLIYFLYYDKLLYSCKKFNLKLLSPEDFIQETFLKIYDQRHQLNEDVSLEAQIVVICKNIILNHLNREKKITRLNIKTLKNKSLDNESDSDINYRKEKLYHFIEELPRQQKKIFILHKLNSYSYNEIATITKLSSKTIANHIYLAKSFIKTKLMNLPEKSFLE